MPPEWPVSLASSCNICQDSTAAVAITFIIGSAAIRLPISGALVTQAGHFRRRR